MRSDPNCAEVGKQQSGEEHFHDAGASHEHVQDVYSQDKTRRVDTALTNAHTPEIKNEEYEYGENGVARDSQDNQGKNGDSRAHPVALRPKVIDVTAGLNGRPEEALQATLAPRHRIGQAEGLHAQD